jgi:hypothetical protein
MRRVARGFLLVIAALVAAGCGGSGDEQAAAPVRVADLTSLDQFRAAFDDAAGRPRLVLLLSPT